MNVFYTLNRSAAALGCAFACFFTACQSSVSDKTAAVDSYTSRIERGVELRFSERVAANHALPESESAELRELQAALDGTSQAQVQKILAQLPGKTSKEQPKVNEAPKDSAAALPVADTLQMPESSIVQNAALLLQVRNYAESYGAVKDLAKQYQARIISEEEHSSDSLMENTFVLLVAPRYFDSVVGDLREMAMIIRQKRIWQKDLTAQFVDLNTRLSHKQEAQMRLKGLLDNAKRADEILPIRRELDEVTAELESLVRSTRALSEKAVFATVTATVYQVLDNRSAQADFSERFTGGLSQGWVDFKDFLLRAAGSWPWVVLGFLLFLAVVIAVRSSRRQARNFQLQALQNQQQWLEQQQKFAANLRKDVK